MAESKPKGPDLSDILKDPKDTEKDQPPKNKEPEAPMSMIGAIVLCKNPSGSYSPAIVLDDFGGNLKLVAFYDDGQRMGYVSNVLVPDAAPEPNPLPDNEVDRPWAYWRALP